MKIAEKEELEPTSFYLQKEKDTEVFGSLVGEFIKVEMASGGTDLIKSVALTGERGSGKTQVSHSIKSAFGDSEQYESKIIPGRRSWQNLTFANSVGWVRHVDASLDMQEDMTIPAARNQNFWEEHGVGVDLVEHANYPDAEYEGREHDYIINMQGAPRIVQPNLPAIPNYSRIATIYADPKYNDNPRYQRLIEDLQERFPVPDALSAESIEPE